MTRLAYVFTIATSRFGCRLSCCVCTWGIATVNVYKSPPVPIKIHIDLTVAPLFLCEISAFLKLFRSC